jgi:hypothetical protein
LERRLERMSGTSMLSSAIPRTVIDRDGQVSIRAYQQSIKRAARIHMPVLPDDQSDSQRSNRPTAAALSGSPCASECAEWILASTWLSGAGGEGSDRSSSSSCAPHEGLLPTPDTDSKRLFRHCPPRALAACAFSLALDARYALAIQPRTCLLHGVLAAFTRFIHQAMGFSVHLCILKVGA